MIGYLGVPGAMVRLPYRGGLDTSSDRPVAPVRTLGGKRKVFVGARARREWSVSFDLIASRDTHGLLAVAQEVGPVLWYPADAVAGNMFSPQAASFESIPNNAGDAGLVALPDGSVAKAVLRTQPGNVYVGTAHGSVEYVPVVAGEPVTVGAWTTGTCQFSLFWRGATVDVGVVGPQPPTFAGGPNWVWREATVTPPATAGFVGVAFAQATTVARPAISWGSTVADRPGRGCPSAVVHGLSEALTVITGDDAYGSIDVTVTEVG